MWRPAVQLCLGLPLGGLAQLARAPALQAGGQRFESVILHHLLCKQGVNGSNPLFSTSSLQYRTSVYDMLYRRKKESESRKYVPPPAFAGGALEESRKGHMADA